MRPDEKLGANVLQLPGQGPQLPGANHFVKVPDGEYAASFLDAESFWYRGKSPRLALWFQIASGEFRNTILPAYCNLKSVDGQPGRRSRDPNFVVGARSDLTDFLTSLFPERYTPHALPTSIPGRDMRARLILVETRTVSKTHAGKERPIAFHSSVVSSVIGWADP